jgi:predicted GH43/DUF377 family glycosyl hydrolase
MAEFKLQRINHEILKPCPENPWESRAIFNPGTIRIGEDVHMLYRAVENDNISTIGYARLDADGIVLERRDQPVITRELEIEKHGCEDPRIVYFDNTYFIFYTAYDGFRPDLGKNARVVMAETSDFYTFKKIGMVGPDFQDKDAMIFSEKINGKVAYLHRIEPNIQLALFEELEHFINPEKNYWPDHLKNLDKYTVMEREFKWEEAKIGAGPPPIRTEAGWLLIYHGVDKNHIYRAGAVLLDERNPYKVIARLPYPILEPERDYEKLGDVDMVVFPEGLVQFDDELQVYYGGADKVIGLAIGSLRELIDELWKHRLD